MKAAFYIQENEDGSALVIALVMLVLLTLIGISASTTSEIELKISGNDKLHKMAFYTAESGWQVGANWLDSNYPPVVSSTSVAPTGMPSNNTLTYSYSTTFDGAVFAPGYSTEFRRFMYTINSTGNAPGGALSNISVTAGKIVHVGGY